MGRELFSALEQLNDPNKAGVREFYDDAKGIDPAYPEAVYQFYALVSRCGEVPMGRRICPERTEGGVKTARLEAVYADTGERPAGRFGPKDAWLTNDRLGS